MTDQTGSDGSEKKAGDEELKQIVLTCGICQKNQTQAYWDTVEGILTLTRIDATDAHDLRVPMCQECWDKFAKMFTGMLRKELVCIVRRYFKLIESES